MSNLYVATDSTDYADGTILRDGKVVCPAVPHPGPLPETVDGEKVVIQEAHDGTLIRMFYDNEEQTWVCATNYSLDLTTLSIRLEQTTTFQTMIDAAMLAVDLSFDKMNTELIYLFMLEHPDNIIIVQHMAPNLTPVMTMRLTDNEPFYEVVDFCMEDLLPKTKLASTCVQREALAGVLNNRTTVGELKQVERVGLIINVVNDGKLVRYRINTPEYDAVKEMMGSTGSKSFRCLQIMCSKNYTHEHSTAFLDVLPNYAPAFLKTWKELQQLGSMLEKFYRMYYIDNNIELVDPEFSKVLYKLHVEECGSSPNKVMQYLLQLDAPLVACLLNIMRNSIKKCTPEELEVIMQY